MKYFILLLIMCPMQIFSQKRVVSIESMYKSVGLISWTSTKSDTNGVGTGTVILKYIDNNRVGGYLVTCKHVLPDKSLTSFIDFKIGYNENDSIKKIFTTKIPIYDAVGYYTPLVKVAQDGSDVAVIFISFPDSVAKYILKDLISYNFLATKDTIAKYGIQVGDDILYIGYPNAFYDPRNISPLLKGGFISTPPNEVYYFNPLLRTIYNQQIGGMPEKLNGFLIDINATGGSSGSLVFLNPKPVRKIGNGIQLTYEGGYLFILGILTSGYQDLDIRVFKQKLNIIGVVSSEVIKRTIDLFPAK